MKARCGAPFVLPQSLLPLGLPDAAGLGWRNRAAERSGPREGGDGRATAIETNRKRRRNTVTAGENRKFHRNMEFERSSRKLAVVALQFAAFIAPIALFVFAVAAVVAIFTGHDVLRVAGLKGNHVLMAATLPIVPTITGGGLVKARELREQRGKLVADMQKLVPESGTLSKEDRDKFDKMDADQKELLANIETIERAEALAAETRTRVPQDAITPEQQAAAVLEEKRSKAFNRFLKVGTGEEFAQRAGMTPLTAEERNIVQGMFRAAETRDMGTGGGNALQGTGGGYFVPVGFVNKIEEALKFFGGMLQSSTVMSTDTGQPLPYPTDNDTSNSGELVGESQPVSLQDVSIGNITFGAYKFSTKFVRVSIEMLQDSAFDIESYLAKKFATRIGRSWNNYFTVGTGTSQPKGIVTAATVGVGGGTSPAIIGDDNATSPDPTLEIGYKDLVALEHSVDVAYRTGAKFMGNDATIRNLKFLKDKYGRPLWVPGIATNQPDTILGYQWIVNNDMAVPAASAKTLLFGALDKYLIRKVKELQIMRLNERFADYGQVGFLGFARADGNLLDAGTHPVKVLQQHA
jgi:HK97 family phage major capsid protein